jgi:hypothetical protein
MYLSYAELALIVIDVDNPHNWWFMAGLPILLREDNP